MTEEQFKTLLHGFRQQKLTRDELQLFLEKAAEPEFEALLGDQFVQDLAGYERVMAEESDQQELVWARLDAQRTLSGRGAAPVHRVHFLRKWWWAAASVIVIVVAVYLLKSIDHKEGRQPAIVSKQPVPDDIPPARNAAILTLADGSTIVLDSVANGNLASQGGTRIVKLDDGRLQYVSASSARASGEVLYNTMRTPAGTQYRLSLPDGTNVWLNAASSITYPTSFEGNRRNVKVTGEAYFEVAKNKEKPFVVNVNDKFSIQVLGTSFNVKAYANEAVVRTTLLEGKVNVKSEAGNQKSDAQTSDLRPQTSVVLKPGEQAVLTHDSRLTIDDKVDMEKVMAWKNGLFNFHNAQLEEVMREIARWYDIEVIYEKGTPHIEFVGKISRDLNLSQVLNGLKGTGFNFRIEEGRKLVITP